MKNNKHETLIILGILPFLAVTSKVYYAIWLAPVFVIITLLTALTACLTRTVVRGRASLIANTAVCAGLTSAAVMIFDAVMPTAAAGMGISLSVMAVNWLVFAVCEANVENGMKASVKNAAAASVAGAVLLVAAAAVRELLVNGTLFAGFSGSEGVRIFGDWFGGMDFTATPAGGLLIFAFAAAGMQKIGKNIRSMRREKKLRREVIVSGEHPDLVRDAETGKIVRRSTEEILMKKRSELAANAENTADAIKAFDENELNALSDAVADNENVNEEAKHD